MVSSSAKSEGWCCPKPATARKGLSASTSAKVQEIEETLENLTGPVNILRIFFGWFSLTAIVGLLFPETMLTLRGVESNLNEECSSGPTVVIRTLEQTQVLQSLLMAGLHGVVLGTGVPEARFTTTHHLKAIRTLLVTDTVWLTIACVWAWVFAVPAMREHGWHYKWVLAESAILCVLGLLAFVDSRGDTVSGMGGYFRVVTNGASLRMPSLCGRNYGLMCWAIVAAVASQVSIWLPDMVLQMTTKDYLKGNCFAMSSLLVQLMGVCFLNQLTCIVAILGENVVALHYAATRLLWFWAFGMAVFVLGAQQVQVHLKLPHELHYLVAAGFLALFAICHYSMAEFAKVSTIAKTTGRTD